MLSVINISRLIGLLWIVGQVLGCHSAPQDPQGREQKKAEKNLPHSPKAPVSGSIELSQDLPKPGLEVVKSDADANLPSVTIAVATYTKRNMFHELLHESFLRQDYPAHKIDLLVYENGDIKSPYFSTAHFERVRYVHTNNPNDVLGVKRNWLVENAKGDIVVVFDDDDFYASDYVRRMVNMLLENPDYKIIKIQNWVMLNYSSNTEADDPNLAKTNFSLVYPYLARDYGWGFSFVFFKDVFPTCQYAPSARLEEDPFAQCIEARFGSKAIRRIMQKDNEKQLVLKLDSKRRILKLNNYANRNIQRELESHELGKLYLDGDMNYVIKYIEKSDINRPVRI